MRRPLLRLLINTLGLFAAVTLVTGVSFTGVWWHLIVVALIFGAVNALLRPVLMALTCPLMIVTLGLFTLVINAALFWLTARISGVLGLGFTARSFWAAFLGALVTALVAVLAAFLFRPEGEAQSSQRRA